MSIETWKNEFYPIEATQLGGADLFDAINHSLQKWVGLRPVNVKKHGLTHHKRGLLIDNVGNLHTVATASHCALCCRFIDDQCVDCPIATDGPVREYGFDEGCNVEYRQFINNHDPEPMISALMQAKLTLLTQTGGRPALPDLLPPIVMTEPVAATTTLQALSVLDAMELARKVLDEIGTTGGKYGRQFGDIVYDSTRAEYALRKAMEKLGKPS